MTDPASHDLMAQAADAFEAAGAPASLRPLALASLADPDSASLFISEVESFCRSIQSAELSYHARMALNLASRAALTQKDALAGESLQSRQASNAMMSYLSNSSPEA